MTEEDAGHGERVPMEAWAYAFDKVGFMVLPDTRHLFGADELRRWDRAVQEYLDEQAGWGNGTELG